MLAERLHASRGSVSGMARLLEQVGLIRRHTRPGDRREYFDIPPDALHRLMEVAIVRLRQNREMAEAGLALIADRPPESQARLRDIRDLYAFFEREWPAILARMHELETASPDRCRRRAHRQTKGSDRMTAVIETEQLTKSYGTHRGIVDVDLSVERGRGVRLPRPERRRQDDDDPHAARPHPPDERAGARLRHRDDRRPGRHPPAARLPAGRVRALRQADRRPDDRVLREPARRRRRAPTRPTSSRASTSTRAGSSGSTRRATSRRSAWSSRSSIGPTCSSSTSRRRASTRSSSRRSTRSSARPRPRAGRSSCRATSCREVEKTCDRVAIIRDGRLARVDRVEALRDLAHHQVELRFVGEVPVARVRGAARRQRRRRPRTSRSACASPARSRRSSGPRPSTSWLDFVSREPSLEETFLAEYGADAGRGGLT